ncbi:MAG: hypothetical protein ACTHOD_17820 [Motilibacteraceae bacterium]
MSRERARRRAAAEAERARLAAERERAAARSARRRHAVGALAAPVVGSAAAVRRSRWRGQQGVLARRRRVQNGVAAGLFVASQLLTWLLTDDPWARLASFVVALCALPVLLTLVLDRRS